MCDLTVHTSFTKEEKLMNLGTLTQCIKLSQCLLTNAKATPLKAENSDKCILPAVHEVYLFTSLKTL